MLVRHSYLSELGVQRAAAFKNKTGKYPTKKELPDDVLEICHSFVTGGKIRYLNDCTHHLKGKTVELLDF